MNLFMLGINWWFELSQNLILSGSLDQTETHKVARKHRYAIYSGSGLLFSLAFQQPDNGLENRCGLFHFGRFSKGLGKLQIPDLVGKELGMDALVVFMECRVEDHFVHLATLVFTNDLGASRMLVSKPCQVQHLPLVRNQDSGSSLSRIGGTSRIFLILVGPQMPHQPWRVIITIPPCNMRLVFKIRGDRFDELVLLLKKLSAFCKKESKLCLIIERPNKDDPHGNIRLHIDKPNPVLMMIDAKYFLDEIAFKCQQEMAIIAFTSHSMFFRFLADARSKSAGLVFSLKRQRNLKFMHVVQEDGDSKQIFRILVQQKGIMDIEFWGGVIEPTVRCKIQNKNFRQFFRWVSGFQSICKFILNFSIKSDSRGWAIIKMSADLTHNVRIEFQGRVAMEIGTDIDQSRYLKRDQFSILKNCISMNYSVSLLMKDSREFAFQISGNAFNLQIQLLTFRRVKEES